MDALTVALNGIKVGTLKRHRSGALAFKYQADWLARPGARPISLSLPLSERTYQGNVVYNFFDNLLPDNEAIRARIQARFHMATKQPFDLLASIGRDCVGAIQLYPEGIEIPPVGQMTAEPLDESASPACWPATRTPRWGWEWKTTRTSASPWPGPWVCRAGIAITAG